MRINLCILEIDKIPFAKLNIENKHFSMLFILRFFSIQFSPKEENATLVYSLTRLIYFGSYGDKINFL